MGINRNLYLKKLIDREHNGLIKVITGLRRSGKSYLLNTIFRNHLIEKGVDPSQIISFAFDNMEDVMKLDEYYTERSTLLFDAKGNYKVDSRKFYKYINDLTTKNQKYYLLLDEIQLLDNFVMTLNGFLTHDNFDVYVTGSNSKMLSKDIITEFRGRGDQIKMFPLSFKEYYSARNLSFEDAYYEYQYYGGMPYVLKLDGQERKKEYLKNLFTEIYIKDITERNNIKDTGSFEELLNVLSSSIGSYTNPTNLENTFKSKANITYNHETIRNHIEFIKDAFLISESKKYNIKGRKYINSNSKFYFTDIGLRNALINFRQDEPTHIMENIIYNELATRGYDIDVGIIESSEKNANGNYVQRQLETDFVCNNIDERIYIQSAYSMENIEKFKQEKRSLLQINDNFKKVIIVKDNIKDYMTEEGIKVMSLKNFLLEIRD